MIDQFLGEMGNYAWGITLYQLALSFLILFATLLLRRVVIRRLLQFFESRAEKSVAKWDNEAVHLLKPPLDMLVLVIGLWFAARVLPLPKEPLDLDYFVNLAGVLLTLGIITWGALRLVAIVENILKFKAGDPEHWLEISFVPLIVMSLRILVAIVSLIVIAQNLGYSISGLLASLGLGGAALALASKDTIANLFGSLMIIVDKPFTVGDWIKGDGFEGVVEEIGFRSTRIRTFGKTIENIPNNVLANIKVENMDRRKDKGLNVRRIKMTIGVTYSTAADKMEELLKAIKETISDDEGVDNKQTILVRFTGFGASSLDIFIYYFSDRADWDYYLSVRERINLKLMRLLEERGIGFAFPSQSVYIESMPTSYHSSMKIDSGL